MKSIYKTRFYRILLNLLFGLGFAVFVTAIASLFVKNSIIGILLFIGAFTSYIWLMIIGNIITIEVEGPILRVIKCKKKIEYDIEKISIRAVTKTSRGETGCKLYLKKEDGSEDIVDCELIGIAKFEELLQELGLGNSITKLN